MKDKIKDIIGVVITILIIVFAILWYPWFTSTKDDKTVCHNILGYEMSCFRW